MVVDDTDHVRQMLASMLTLDGFEVVEEAASGSEAVRRIEGADPDVVVIDYRMPGMDGLDTARTIKERRPGQLMVLYTAFIDADLQKADDVLAEYDAQKSDVHSRLISRSSDASPSTLPRHTATPASSAAFCRSASMKAV
jgi:CheY-like chemotaxis protein